MLVFFILELSDHVSEKSNWFMKKSFTIFLHVIPEVSDIVISVDAFTYQYGNSYNLILDSDWFAVFFIVGPLRVEHSLVD